MVLVCWEVLFNSRTSTGLLPETLETTVRESTKVIVAFTSCVERRLVVDGKLCVTEAVLVTLLVIAGSVSLNTGKVEVTAGAVVYKAEPFITEVSVP